MQNENIRINDYQYFVLLFEQASVQKRTNGEKRNFECRRGSRSDRVGGRG